MPRNTAKPTEIAARLRAARMAKGVTQVQAAQHAGVDVSAIARFERGLFGVDRLQRPRSEPPRPVLTRLCVFYGVTPGSVLSGGAPN